MGRDTMIIIISKIYARDGNNNNNFHNFHCRATPHTKSTQAEIIIRNFSRVPLLINY